MGATLFWPLFQREYRVSRSFRCHRMPAHHGWVKLRAVGRRTQQGHRDTLASGNAPYCSHCTKSFASAGKKEVYHRTWWTPISLPRIRTRAWGTTVTTTETSPYSALSAKYLLGSYWSASRSWRRVSTRSHNVASELKGQQYTWYSPFSIYKRRAENRRYHCTSLALIALMRLI